MWLLSDVIAPTMDWIYHRLPSFNQPAAISKPGEVTLPQTNEGTSIPLIYGRVRIESPVLAWAGNWFPSPDGTSISGFTYFLSLLWIMGTPFYGGQMSLSAIWVNNFALNLIAASPITGTSAVAGKSTYVSNNGAAIYGGAGHGGGIVGNIEFFDGRPTQKISDGLNNSSYISAIEAFMTGNVPTSPPAGFQTSAVDARLIPSYRGIGLCFLWDWDIGESPNITPYGFEVISLSTGTAADLGNSLANDADPAAVIFDILTGRFSKLGLPESIIDKASFQTASTALFNEGHGYSRIIDSPTDAVSIIDDVLKQTDGVVYQDPSTGLITYKLIRNDYNISTLDDINPDNAEAAGDSWYAVQGWAEMPNRVMLSFTNRSNAYQTATIIADNQAAITAAGGRIRKVSISYAGCCTVDLARALAARELAAVSRPMVRATVVVSRAFYQKKIGDVVTLTWPDLGINKMVMRVARVNRGRPGASAITLDLIRDVTGITVDVSYPAA